MNEQDGINYDALAKAHYVAGKQLFGMTEDVLWGGATEHAKQQSRYKARAVIAAYLDQRRAAGVVEVRAGDVTALIDWLHTNERYMDADGRDALARLRAATAEPGAGS